MNKRVLLVIDQIASGGAEKILLELNNYLKSQGYSTKIFSLYGNNETIAASGLKNNSANIVIKYIQQKILFKKLRKYASSFSPDIIFSFLERSNVLVSKLDIDATKIVTVHNILSIQYRKLNSLINKFVKSDINRAYSKVDKIIVVSDNIRQDLIQEYNIPSNKIFTINNRIDKAEIIKQASEPITEFELDNDSCYITNIGRFCYQKAQWKIVKVIKKLKTEYPQLNVKGLIIGEGILKSKLMEFISDLNLEKDIIILPYQSNPYKFIAKSNLFLLPSFFEGCPIVLSEVVALGIPFVGSEKAIPKEYFDVNSSYWKDATFEISEFEEFGACLGPETEDITNKIMNQMKTKSSVIGTRIWNNSNDKKNQFEEYVDLF